MKVTIQARHFNARDDLKKSVEKEVMRLERLYDRILEADVILEGKLHRKEAQISIKVPGQTLVASDMADRFEIAAEAAVDKLEQQVKRYRDKMRKR